MRPSPTARDSDLGGYGDVTITAGGITSPTATINLSISKGGLGILNVSGNNAAWTATTQGTMNTPPGPRALT